MNSFGFDFGFIDHSDVRKMFRKIVLPVNDIQRILDLLLQGRKITNVLDFGAGTFFWTDYFVTKYNCTVYAVDSYYEKIDLPAKKNVKTYSTLDSCLNDCSSFSLVWACDVLHHISEKEQKIFLDKILNKTKLIAIKDIDANHHFGNFMNKTHDKLINHENVNSVYPKVIENTLVNGGGGRNRISLFTQTVVSAFYGYGGQ
ncbi:MAG: hypothetical protein Ta2A_08850 [Treponemataceae bacterium]|nr:MAG: hypothetical protein Ta2A_08850 [Treponemataceae bacterium]